MIVNPFVFPTLLVSLALFGLGTFLAKRLPAWTLVIPAFICLGISFLFPLAYARILDHNLWYLNFRYLKGTEMLSSLGSFGVAALLMRQGGEKEKKTALFLGLGLAIIPFLKPLVFPLLPGNIRNQWRGKSCLQSTLATCGPCTMATLLKHQGVSVTEAELAKDAFTYGRGTENWYLRRAVEKRGYKSEIILLPAQSKSLPYPSLAGTQLRGQGGTGHFIAILGRKPGKWLISDPLFGEMLLSEEEFRNRYFFTGFFMVISPLKLES